VEACAEYGIKVDPGVGKRCWDRHEGGFLVDFPKFISLDRTIWNRWEFKKQRFIWNLQRAEAISTNDWRIYQWHSQVLGSNSTGIVFSIQLMAVVKFINHVMKMTEIFAFSEWISTFTWHIERKMSCRTSEISHHFRDALNCPISHSKDFSHIILKLWKIDQIRRENIPENRLTSFFQKLVELLSYYS